MSLEVCGPQLEIKAITSSVVRIARFLVTTGATQMEGEPEARPKRNSGRPKRFIEPDEMPHSKPKQARRPKQHPIVSEDGKALQMEAPHVGGGGMTVAFPGKGSQGRLPR